MNSLVAEDLVVLVTMRKEKKNFRQKRNFKRKVTLKSDTIVTALNLKFPQVNFTLVEVIKDTKKKDQSLKINFNYDTNPHILSKNVQNRKQYMILTSSFLLCRNQPEIKIKNNKKISIKPYIHTYLTFCYSSS